MAVMKFDKEGDGPNSEFLTRENFHENVRGVFSPRADSYESGNTGNKHKRWVDTLLRYFLPELPALDVACGPGALSATASLEGRGAGWTNLDITPAMVQAAKQRAPESTCVTAAVEDLDQVFPGNDQFASVFCCCAMIYFTDIPGFLRSVVRLLRPGGFFAAHLFTVDSFSDVPALEAACLTVLGRSRGPRVFSNPNAITADASAVEALLTDAGFASVENHIVEDTRARMRVEELAARWEGGGKQGEALKSRVYLLDEQERESIRLQFVEELEGMADENGFIEERVNCMYVRGWKAARIQAVSHG